MPKSKLDAETRLQKWKQRAVDEGQDNREKLNDEELALRGVRHLKKLSPSRKRAEELEITIIGIYLDNREDGLKDAILTYQGKPMTLCEFTWLACSG
jgi:hypothetical protein